VPSRLKNPRSNRRPRFGEAVDDPSGKRLEASLGFCFPDNLVGNLSAPDLG